MSWVQTLETYSSVFREGATCYGPSALKMCTIFLPETSTFMHQLTKALDSGGLHPPDSLPPSLIVNTPLETYQ